MEICCVAVAAAACHLPRCHTASCLSLSYIVYRDILYTYTYIHMYVVIHSQRFSENVLGNAQPNRETWQAAFPFFSRFSFLVK